MARKNANSSPGVWLALLLVLVAHTLAQITRLENVTDEDFSKNEENSENDRGLFPQKIPLRGGIAAPIMPENVRKPMDDNAEDLYIKTGVERDLGKSIDDTEKNSGNGSSDKTVEKQTVDEIATTVKTTPAHTTVPELDSIPTITTIDFQKHLTTIHEGGAIEKTEEKSLVESGGVQTNRTSDAIIDESRNEEIRDSDVKPLTNTGQEFELVEENEHFEEHTNSQFAEGTTTPSTKLVGVDRQKIVEDSHKNVEHFDTEQSDDRDAGSKDVISLVNDTNVNYNRHFENGTRRFQDNDTNTSTTNDGGVNLGHEPKHEVEIFKNVTYPSTLRLTEDSGNDSVADNTTPYYTSSRPKGRTISITGDNDLSLEKPKAVNQTNVNEARSNTIMRIFPKKSGPTEKPTELKPYPYLKTESKLSDDQLVTEIPKREEESPEEITAFENTIGGKKSDEKIIVTEPSVLVENSIQQLKPIHNKRSGNSSRVNSTFDTPVTSTAWSLGTEGDSASKNGAGVTEESDKILENGTRSQINNDVPQDHPGKSSTTEKSPVILSEVTENNIEIIIGKTNGTNNDTISTPTSKKLIDHPGVSTGNVTQTTLELGDIRDANSTERIETVSNGFSTSNEIRTGNEDAKMSLNQFKNTDRPTERPLPLGNFTTSTKILTSVPNATEKVGSEVETTVSLPMTIAPTTESTQSSQSGMPMTQSTETKSVVENVANVTGIEKISESHGSTRSFTEPTIGQTTTVPYERIGLTTSEMDSTVSPVDVTSSESTNAVTNLINETSTATESHETTTDDSIGQNDTTVSRMVETGETEEPAPPTTPSPDTPTTYSGEVEVTTSDDQSNATDSPVSESSSTDVYTDTTSSRSSIDHRFVDVTTSGQSDNSEDPTITIITETEPSIGETTVVSNIEVIVPLGSTTLPTTTITTQSTTLETTSTSKPPEFDNSGDGVTLFVRIIIDGSWSEVCQVLNTLRSSLANLLTEYTDKIVLSRNIILYKTQCTLENIPSTGLTTVLLFVVDDNGDFDYAMTEALPSVYKQSSIEFPLPIHSVEKLQENLEPSNNAIAVVAVSSVAFICLVLLAGLLFIMRKRQTRFNYGERCRPVSLDAFRVDSVSAYNSVRRKGLTRASKRSYGNPAFEDSSVTPTHPLNFAGLSTFCNDSTAITEEFSGIPQVTARMDELPAGAEVKNRYANVAPLPETRVLLQKINNEPLTEYINASYVRGPKNAMKYYIACQAPMESTVSDFWRMIWEQQSKVIIMLTDIVENGVEKCVEYIPPSEVTDCHRLYGDYQVTLKKREAKEKYAISTLHLKNLENNTYREVSHIWYLWPTNGVPSNGTGLIAVLLEARALQRGAPAPIVVHCSPGTGRTGTLIALDLGIRQYEITRTVDVPRVVYTIRRDRAGAVQTKEQYSFIYKALNLYAAKLAGGALESM